MNACIHSFKSYFEYIIHPAAGKSEPQKTKRRSSKPSFTPPASPDSLHIRAAVRANNAVRRNPAP
ncbi:MAG TPA: hypothetical protein VMR70_01275 [Flavisolibacter sp.]|nr:hypothetical protein [Flavisolibacter sp.]